MTPDIVYMDGEDHKGHQGRIFGIYNSFINELPNILGKGKLKYPDKTVDMRFEDGELEIYCPPGDVLRFKEVPYGGDDSDEELHICAQFEQTVRGVDVGGEVRYELSKSTVRTTYLRLLSDRDEDTGKYDAEIKQGLHFDFERDPDDNHPVFHVQYDPRSIETDILEKNYNLPRLGRFDDSYPQSPRVPTAPIDVGGAIHMILRQCLEDELNWPGRLESDFAQLPTFPHDCFEPAPQDGNCLVPEWWYVHCTEGQTDLPQDLVDLRSRNWS
jgi:hypothetical protein